MSHHHVTALRRTTALVAAFLPVVDFAFYAFLTRLPTFILDTHPTFVTVVVRF